MKTIKPLFIAIGLVGLVACGDQDPTKDYPKAKTSRPPDVVKREEARQPRDLEPVVTTVTETKVIPPKDPQPQAPGIVEAKTLVQKTIAAVYKVDGPTIAEFTEGETASHTYSYRVFEYADKVTLTLTASNLPRGADFKKVDAKNWKLTWTPENGYIPSGDGARDQKIKIFVVANTSNAEAKALFNMVPKEEEFTLMVRQSNKAPTLKVVGLDAQVQEGEVVSFYVEVKDPTSYKNNPPVVMPAPELKLTSENTYAAPGYAYVRPDPRKEAIEMVNETTWRQHFVFDTKNTPVMAQLDPKGTKKVAADALNTRFVFKATGRTGNSSAAEPISVAIKYNTPQVADAGAVK